MSLVVVSLLGGMLQMFALLLFLFLSSVNCHYQRIILFGQGAH
jgi:hypothetical protein